VLCVIVGAAYGAAVGASQIGDAIIEAWEEYLYGNPGLINNWKACGRVGGILR
jgi:hypothetical protein